MAKTPADKAFTRGNPTGVIMDSVKLQSDSGRRINAQESFLISCTFGVVKGHTEANLKELFWTHAGTQVDPFPVSISRISELC